MQALLASFHLVSVDDHSLLPPSPRSVSPYQSDDEVVWSPSLSSSSASVAEPGSHSEASDDDDFVLLNKPRKIPRRWSDLINGSDPSNDQSDERDQSPPSRNSPATKQPFIDTTIGAADSGQAGSPASPCTPVDRTAGATPIPASERRIAARPATRSTRSPPVEVPTSTSISASTQEARNQRKSEQATCPKALRKLKRERKKEAKAATAKATTPEDKAKARKERRKAARQRRRDRKMLQKEEAGATARPVPLVTKATPTKPKVITTTTSPEMYEEASRFITSCVNSTCHLDYSSILDQVPRRSHCQARLGLPFDSASIFDRRTWFYVHRTSHNPTGGTRLY